jgi:hypothetical protein
MSKIISICKNGVRYDFPLELEKGGPGSGRKPESGSYKIEQELKYSKELQGKIKEEKDPKRKEELENELWESNNRARWLEREQAKMTKQEPIASDEPVISQGAIVTLNGHKGKVLDTEGDMATVSWEDASISEVPIADLEYEGRVEKQITADSMHPNHSREHKFHFPRGFNDGEKDAQAGSPKSNVKNEHRSYQAGYHTGYHAAKKKLAVPAQEENIVAKGGPGSGRRPGIGRDVNISANIFGEGRKRFSGKIISQDKYGNTLVRHKSGQEYVVSPENIKIRNPRKPTGIERSLPKGDRED